MRISFVALAHFRQNSYGIEGSGNCRLWLGNRAYQRPTRLGTQELQHRQSMNQSDGSARKEVAKAAEKVRRGISTISDVQVFGSRPIAANTLPSGVFVPRLRKIGSVVSVHHKNCYMGSEADSSFQQIIEARRWRDRPSSACQIAAFEPVSKTRRQSLERRWHAIAGTWPPTWRAHPKTTSIAW